MLTARPRRRSQSNPLDRIVPQRHHRDAAPRGENPAGEAATTRQRPPQFRVRKILDVKRQLGEGRYDLEEKLDVVAGRLLEDLR